MRLNPAMTMACGLEKALITSEESAGVTPTNFFGKHDYLGALRDETRNTRGVLLRGSYSDSRVLGSEGASDS